MPVTELAVALDLSHLGKAWALLNEIRGMPVVLKVGSELFSVGGPAFVSELVKKEYRVFLDLKFHDIPNTVGRSASQVSKLGIEMFTVHLTGGREMIQNTKKHLAEQDHPPKVLGVSVLTSFSNQSFSEVTQLINEKDAVVEKAVTGLVNEAVEWGVDGVVCSAKELPSIRKSHSDLYIVVPGVRPEGSENKDQARVVTPKEAAQVGANLIVVGRPVYESDRPRKMIEEILSEIY